MRTVTPSNCSNNMVSNPVIDNDINCHDSFPIMGNKILFDFLIKPYLNIKTMVALTNTCSTFREYSAVDNNKLWYKYHCVLDVEHGWNRNRNGIDIGSEIDRIGQGIGKGIGKGKKRKGVSEIDYNMEIHLIDKKFDKYAKNRKFTLIPTISYYHRVFFAKVFTINDSIFKNTQENINMQCNLIKVTLTQKDQLKLLFPEKPSHICNAIRNCDSVVKMAEKDIEILRQWMVLLQLYIDIRQNIRLFEKEHFGSTSPL